MAASERRAVIEIAPRGLVNGWPGCTHRRCFGGTAFHLMLARMNMNDPTMLSFFFFSCFVIINFIFWDANLGRSLSYRVVTVYINDGCIRI